MSNTQQLPLYQCHKQVRAAEITGIRREDTGIAETATLSLYGGYTVTVDAAWLLRNPKLEVGGYFVQYLEGDGYTSFSPAGPFEGGYTLVRKKRAPDYARLG